MITGRNGRCQGNRSSDLTSGQGSLALPSGGTLDPATRQRARQDDGPRGARRPLRRPPCPAPRRLTCRLRDRRVLLRLRRQSAHAPGLLPGCPAVSRRVESADNPALRPPPAAGNTQYPGADLGLKAAGPTTGGDRQRAAGAARRRYPGPFVSGAPGLPACRPPCFALLPARVRSAPGGLPPAGGPVVGRALTAPRRPHTLCEIVPCRIGWAGSGAVRRRFPGQGFGAGGRAGRPVSGVLERRVLQTARGELQRRSNVARPSATGRSSA